MKKILIVVRVVVRHHHHLLWFTKILAHTHTMLSLKKFSSLFSLGRRRLSMGFGRNEWNQNEIGRFFLIKIIQALYDREKKWDEKWSLMGFHLDSLMEKKKRLCALECCEMLMGKTRRRNKKNKYIWNVISRRYDQIWWNVLLRLCASTPKTSSLFQQRAALAHNGESLKGDDGNILRVGQLTSFWSHTASRPTDRQSVPTTHTGSSHQPWATICVYDDDDEVKLVKY